MKTTAITIFTAGLLLGVTAALAQGTNPGAIGNGSVPFQSLQPLTGGQGLGYSEPVIPGDTGLNNPKGSD